jgi:protein required for attachment to host cells
MHPEPLFRLPDADTCIVVCSAGGARCWRSQSRHGDWTLVKEWRHAPGTLHEAEFSSDKPGRSFDSVGGARHAMEPPHSGRELALHAFCEQLAGYLDHAVAAGEFRYVVLLAEPKMLGMLRDELSAATRNSVVCEAPKNLANLEVADIREYFT